MGAAQLRLVPRPGFRSASCQLIARGLPQPRSNVGTNQVTIATRRATPAVNPRYVASEAAF